MSASPTSGGSDPPQPAPGGRVDELDDRELTVPLPERLAAAGRFAEEALAEHRAALATGASTYRDPASGYRVLTAAALAERGTCCRRGCRHCPYRPD